MKATPSSDGQAFSAFLTAALDDFTSIGGLHFLAKSVRRLSFDVGLIRE